jgi:hypothetical protein
MAKAIVRVCACGRICKFRDWTDFSFKDFIKGATMQRLYEITLIIDTCDQCEEAENESENNGLPLR